MKRAKKLWTISSIFLIQGCVSIERPDTNLCIVNSPLNQMKCYNLKHDYTESGGIKTDAQPTIVPLNGIEAVNKFICTDPDSFANLKAYIKALRAQQRE